MCKFTPSPNLHAGMSTVYIEKRA